MIWSMLRFSLQSEKMLHFSATTTKKEAQMLRSHWSLEATHATFSYTTPIYLLKNL